jgi:hypothetical protein
MDVALDERTRFVIGEQIRSKIDPLDFFHFCRHTRCHGQVLKVVGGDEFRALWVALTCDNDAAVIREEGLM